ncbi:hypothetical protein AVEN_179288-1 [Araneus ventricosus]|uniref:DUF4219 domain-containing protein n=1 Tax=Araneus ventricosus TaxID=182803 RepID=A0A4Y2LB12_ARAVE|nr:hypothetical protein AVEN_179288-1 [Araneus ventricosus]
MDRISGPELSGSNYFIWSLKIQAALSLKQLDSVTKQMKPEGLNEKDASEWEQKNSDAVAYIKSLVSNRVPKPHLVTFLKFMSCSSRIISGLNLLRCYFDPISGKLMNIF